MKRSLSWLVVVGLCLSSGVCQAAAPAEDPILDGVVATVNEHVISLQDVVAAVRPLQRQLKDRYAGLDAEAKQREMLKEALDSLIARYLVLDFHGKQEQKVAEWMVDKRVEEVIRDLFQGDRAELTKALAEDRVTYDEWRNDVREHLIVSMIRRSRMEREVNVSARSVRDAYRKNRDRYRVPAKVKLRMITLAKGVSPDEQAACRQEAEELRQQLTSGTNFALAAKCLSTDDRADRGGDWGWIEARMLRPELAQAASELKPGDISGLVDVGDSLYLLNVEARQEPAQVPFEEARLQIERELRQSAQERAYLDWIDELKKDAYVRVLDTGRF